MNLVYRLVKNERELEEFRQNVELFIGVKFPWDFLLESDVYIGVNNDDEMCSGFLISTDYSSFRAIEGIPKNKRNFEQTRLKEMVEVTGLWVLDNYRGVQQALTLGSFLNTVLLRTNRLFGVLTYSSSNIRLGNLYHLLKGEILYSGETLLLEGMEKVDSETIICFKIENIERNFMKKFEQMGRFIGLKAAA